MNNDEFKLVSISIAKAGRCPKLGASAFGSLCPLYSHPRNIFGSEALASEYHLK